MNDSGIKDIITPATGTKLNIKIIIDILKSLENPSNAKAIVVNIVLKKAITNCVSNTIPNVFTNLFEK